jgi:hypothetical protein
MVISVLKYPQKYWWPSDSLGYSAKKCWIWPGNV